MKKRELKDLLYEQVARIGKAVSSPKRLELLELLAQGEKSVEVLTAELAVDIKLVSAHLRALREAGLVCVRREGKFMIYRLAAGDVAGLWVMLRQVAETHLGELRTALNHLSGDPSRLLATSRATLLEQARQGDVIIIDVRPLSEFHTAHLPYARSMPMAEIEQHLLHLPLDKEIVAYCRGPFCFLADDAVTVLQSKGYRVRKLTDGVSEWQAAGFPVEAGEVAA
ncbi:MAG: metalloregulator ArsR/SmtB family transcription factor [Gammaproteobacteria bacterium]|nr:metalloregulator ArsR/SmtB family transcription factor [Gammaproteobacteria bacterium]